MNNCSICGYPIMLPKIPYGYVGPVCPGAHMMTLPAQPPQELGRYQFTPNPLTADEVRKIIREEIERSRAPGSADEGRS